MMQKALLVALALSLAACAAPPKPPVCDGTNLRAINPDSAGNKLTSRELQPTPLTIFDGR
jgi:starvation-inducible outer membrane lipoprotein